MLIALSVAAASPVFAAPKLKHTGDAWPDHPVSDAGDARHSVATPSGLNIVATFDSSITSDPSSAAIKAAINAAITQLESHIRTPTTVEILFVNTTNGLGGAATYYNSVAYSQYRLDLTSIQTLSTNDRAALKTLPAGPNNPVNGNVEVNLTLALLRTVGETGSGDSMGHVDSTISLNTSICNLSRTGPQDPDKYDLEQVALHEICEVLGAGGAGSKLPDLTGPVGSLDLYRYSAPGVRSYTPSASARAYLSINGGAANLGFFNQSGSGDSGDWDSDLNGFPQVQDAFSTPGLQLDLNLSELTALDVVGYNLNPTALIDDLTDYLSEQTIDHGIKHSLLAKLNAAKEALADGKHRDRDRDPDGDKLKTRKGDTAGACGKLQALIAEVTAQRGRKLTAASADQIIAEAKFIRAILDCP